MSLNVPLDITITIISTITNSDSNLRLLHCIRAYGPPTAAVSKAGAGLANCRLDGAIEPIFGKHVNKWQGGK